MILKKWKNLGIAVLILEILLHTNILAQANPHLPPKTDFPLVIAAGGYATTNKLQPLILKIIKRHRWISVPAQLPPDFTTLGTLKTIECTAKICISSGEFPAGPKPLLYSGNGGYAWSAVGATLPPDFATTGVINSIVCSKSNCVAAGGYSTNLISKPLLLLSKNYGKAWNFLTSSLPSDFMGEGLLNAMTCIGTSCTAVGSYANATQVKPLLLHSSDNGLSWSVESLPLPSDFISSGYLNALTCNGTTCIAIGSYSRNPQIVPLIYLSTNQGTTWSLVTVPLPSDYDTSGFLGSINCSGTQCSAGGNYFNGTVIKPFLVFSNDLGNTWTNASLTLPADFLDSGFVLVESCKFGYCMAAGNYKDKNQIQRPMLLLSKNNGSTWTSVNLPLPPDFANLGYLDALSCIDNNCTASGNYKNTQNILLPLVYISSNTGISWYFISSFLPRDFVNNAVLNASAIVY